MSRHVFLTSSHAFHEVSGWEQDSLFWLWCDDEDDAMEKSSDVCWVILKICTRLHSVQMHNNTHTTQIWNITSSFHHRVTFLLSLYKMDFDLKWISPITPMLSMGMMTWFYINHIKRNTCCICNGNFTKQDSFIMAIDESEFVLI